MGSRFPEAAIVVPLRGYKGHMPNSSDRDLEAEIRSRSIPHHVAFIPDGNRRFSNQTHASLAEGYRAGYDKVEDVLRWCGEFSVPVVSIWVLSIDNFSRPPSEVATLLALIEDRIPALVELQRKAAVPRRLQWLGRRDIFNERLRLIIDRAEAETASYGPFALNLALGYGGREEIVDAVKHLLADAAAAGESTAALAARLTAADIGSRLYDSGPAPDLIVRTSGELRLGGFLLWQSASAELFFCDALWPALRRVEVLEALRSYQQRDRRHGR